MKVTVKSVFDELFKDIKFDKNLYKKINYLNIQLILKDENKNLFGSHYIGCYMVKYLTKDKENFFRVLFDMDYEVVEDEIKKITTIRKDFKIARDSINLVCFYVAHRFLTNSSLSLDQRLEYATEILNYFNFRTLIVLSSNYFIYPISEEETISLYENLSNRYIIKKVQNWKEYCTYRSEEYLKSKYYDFLLKFDNDDELPNAINDLFLRTKDTLKNIYQEFIILHENNEALKRRKSVINDIEGEEVIVDKIYSSEKLYNNLLFKLNDRNSFISTNLIDVTVNIIKNLSFKNLYEFLNIFYDFTHANHKNYEYSTKNINRIIVYSLSYLQRNEVFLSERSDVLKMLNLIVGNILYARSLDKEIDDIKEDIMKLIKQSYKEIKKENVSNKLLNNLKNGFFIYIILRSLID